MNSTAADLISTLSGAAASNEARLRLLERRLAGQDSIEAEVLPQQCVQLYGNGVCMQPGTFAPRQPLGSLAISAQPSAPNNGPNSGVTSNGHQRVSSNGGAASRGPGSKRKRTSSPLDQGPGLLSPEQTAPQSTPNVRTTAAARALFTPGQSAGSNQQTSTANPNQLPNTTTKSVQRSASKSASTTAKIANGSIPNSKNSTGQKTLNAYYPVVDGSSRDSELSNGNSMGHVSAQQQQPSAMYNGVPSNGFTAAQQANMASPNQPTVNMQNQGQTALNHGRTGGGVSPLRPAALPTSNGSLPSSRSGTLAAIPEGRTLETIQPRPVPSADVQSLIAQATASLSEQLGSMEKQLAELQQQHRQATTAAEKRVNELTADLTVAGNRAEALASELDRTRAAAEERESRMRNELMRALFTAARDKRELAKLQLASAAVQLGSIGVHRNGMTLQEVWEDGAAAASLSARQAAIVAQREEVETARKALRKKLAPPPSAARAAAAAAGAPLPHNAPEGGYMDGYEFVTLDEIYKTRLAALKRQEETIKEEAERLATEKAKHVRMLKRLRDEEGSRFVCGTSVLGGRFVLLSMLGKGGFSEVFKAYDLRDLRVVAAKVHQLNPGWSEARKASYVKHAIREVDIQKALRHAHIVSLVDILEIDAHCFATVLEFCEGGDLDTLLRDHSTLPEKEAKSIISQVMSGLAYLNQPGKRIIHYDLKPANILFDSLGAAKITDFGLSKIVEDGATQGMELTSQGAGTYWYLPPEVFEVGGPHAPRITNKVDVWSVGVIFYQMLYGRRPYGEGLSQEQIMRDRVLLGAREVEFPSKPNVSADAKEFIRKCLALKPEHRWDVASAASDPYINGKKQ